jgi:hypothetical protein
MARRAPITKQTAPTGKGEVVPGGGDPVNTHDVLTGSDPAGRFSTAGGDTTCGNDPAWGCPSARSRLSFHPTG